MKKALLLFVLLAVASASAFAHGRGGGGRVHLGLHFGFPLVPHYYYHPPVYYYPYPAYPVVSLPAPPPVYVERDAPAQEDWYYCEQTRAYYPYVKECPGGWKRVPPVPPPAQ